MADEILERRADPGTYSAWSEADGGRARFAWRKTNQDPLQPIRAYRNRLVHGRVIPELWVNVLDAQSGENLGAALYYPRLDKADDYLDWRVAFAPRALPGPGSAVVDTSPPPEFDEAAPIALHAWEIYVEAAWRMHLLPHL